MMGITEADVKKDSNTSIELLAHALEKLAASGVRLEATDLVVQADNTCRECKNNPMIRFLAAQVSCGHLRSATMSYLRSGHSHEDIDQVFGRLAQHIMKVKRIETSDDLCDVVQDFVNKTARPHEKGRFCVKLDRTRDWPLSCACICLAFCNEYTNNVV